MPATQIGVDEFNADQKPGPYTVFIRVRNADIIDHGPGRVYVPQQMEVTWRRNSHKDPNWSIHRVDVTAKRFRNAVDAEDYAKRGTGRGQKATVPYLISANAQLPADLAAIVAAHWEQHRDTLPTNRFSFDGD